MSVGTVELSSDTQALTEKSNRLRAILRELQHVIIAYSGGVDSAYLLQIAREELGDQAQAIIGISPSLMPEELDEARDLAQRIGAPLREIDTFEIDDPNYASNPNNRCYYCKSELFTVLTRLAHEEGFQAVCDGTNVDDLKEWRPGAQAGTERAVRSPLREAGLTKAEIRSLSKTAGLPTWDKQAMPCLSSRIPYGTPVTREALYMIGRAEAFLRRKGLRELRVRHYIESGYPTARLEIAPDELNAIFSFYQEAVEELKRLGYRAVLLDLEGYRRGKLNGSLQARPEPQPIQLFLTTKQP